MEKIKPALSAGRVQSVAVRLIVEREDKISKFKSEKSFKIVAYFKIIKDGKAYEFTADLLKNLKSKLSALEFLNDCKSAKFSVGNIEKSPEQNHRHRHLLLQLYNKKPIEKWDIPYQGRWHLLSNYMKPDQ